MLAASLSEDPIAPEAFARLTLLFESTALSRSNEKSRKPEILVVANSLTLNALRMEFTLHLAQTGLGADNDVEN
jgi:hypothetical protein